MAIKVKFKGNYQSSAAGPFFAGDEVLIDEDVADYIDRDSPGTLERVKADKGKGKEKDKHEAADNRAVLEARNRAALLEKHGNEGRDDRTGSEADAGAITRADFKAVKEKGD